MTPEKIYFRPESGGLVLVGTGDYGDPVKSLDAVDENVGIEHVERIGKLMAHRMPVFENAKLVKSWTGMYDIPPDWNPIIGSVPDHKGVFVGVGFSGHGFKLAPIVGKLLSELVADQKTNSLIDRFNLSRFTINKLIMPQYPFKNIVN